MKRTVGLIGAGYWGKNLARNFYELGALHTICEHKENLHDHYKKLYPEIRLEKNETDIFSNPEIEQIVIAAPALQHYQLAKQSLLAGKDTYVEKPLCMNTKEAEELVSLAQEKGLVLMVGHILQYHPCVKKLQELIATGEIGKLQYIYSNRLNLGSYRVEENALWNFAPHDVSVILSLLNHELPHQVRCKGGAYLTDGIADITLTTLDFAGGVKAHIFVSWLNPFKEQKLVVVGSTGMIVFDDTKPWGEKLQLYRNHVSWQEENMPIANACTPEAVDPSPKEPLKEECLHFLRCCKERLIPHTDGHEGKRVLTVLEAAHRSMEKEGEAIQPKNDN